MSASILSLQEQAPRFHTVGRKYLLHHDIPTMMGWTTCGRVHCISCDRKVTHLSTIMNLDNLVLKSSWDLG